MLNLIQWAANRHGASVESDGFHQAQAAAIQEFGDELGGARHSIENPAHFFPGQDGGQPLWPFGADGVDAPFQILFKDLAVQEQGGVEGLVLRGGGDLLIHGQVGQKGLDPSTSSGHRFRSAHVLGVSFVVVENVAFDPADVSFFGADRVVLEPDRVVDSIKELFGTFAHFPFSIVG